MTLRNNGNPDATHDDTHKLTQQARLHFSFLSSAPAAALVSLFTSRVIAINIFPSD